MPDVSTFWENTKRIVRLAKRPTRSEIWLQLRISLLGLFAVGFVGYVIKMLFLMVTGLEAFGPTT
ncbi:MAG: protein translocase SEC61 complex subunit gamma [Promethearchaeota archaeon]